VLKEITEGDFDAFYEHGFAILNKIRTAEMLEDMSYERFAEMDKSHHIYDIVAKYAQNDKWLED